LTRFSLFASHRVMKSAQVSEIRDTVGDGD
jgi:hypothetical protein